MTDVCQWGFNVVENLIKLTTFESIFSLTHHSMIPCLYTNMCKLQNFFPFLSRLCRCLKLIYKFFTSTRRKMEQVCVKSINIYFKILIMHCMHLRLFYVIFREEEQRKKKKCLLLVQFLSLLIIKVSLNYRNALKNA